MSQEKVKQLPCGISNFERIRKENYYYVDKTEYIEKMEATSSFLFFVRPRRMGKSLFLSVLEQYYDCNKVDRFDELFSGLYIHEHPTVNQGKYLVLRFDFSQVYGDLTELKDEFCSYISGRLDFFLDEYKDYFASEDITKIKSIKEMSKKFNEFNAVTERLKLRKYLILDEYDNFTNAILSLRGGEKDYKDITHGVGFYRDLFKKFKGNFDRILMMGVSPVTMDDLTSGYNIATNITLDEWFNSALGFSETDVRQMIEYYRFCGAITLTADELMKEMKPWYDNNCFSIRALKKDKVYNSNMVLYYMSNVLRYNRPPDEMVDNNTITDYKKLKTLINIDISSPYRKAVLKQIAEEGRIICPLKSSFPAEYVRNQENYISLLFYYGMLTISGIDGEDLILSIPNRCVRNRYWEYMREAFYEENAFDDSEELRNSYRAMAKKGDFAPFVACMGKRYHASTSIRSAIQGERAVQAYLLAFLGLTTYFIVKPERELAHGYADFVLYPNLSRFDYLRDAYIVELKYISKTDDSEELRAAKLHEAREQLTQYATDKVLAALPQDTKIHKVIVMCAGDDMMMEEIKE